MDDYFYITGDVWKKMEDKAKKTIMNTVVDSEFGMDGLSNILSKFVLGGITGEEIEEQLGESRDYEQLLRFIDDDPTVTSGAKGTTIYLAQSAQGGNRKARKNKSRKNQTRKNKSRKIQTRKNKSRKNKSRKNKSRKNKSHKNKSRKNKTRRNKRR
jgi:hypothetical protein